MNYTFYFDGQPWDKPDIPIGHIFRDPWQRPVLGAEVKIKGRVFKVVRISPTANPDNAAVTYYVEPVNGNWPYMADK